jgi:hypothetical protein
MFSEGFKTGISLQWSQCNGHLNLYVPASLQCETASVIHDEHITTILTEDEISVSDFNDIESSDDGDHIPPSPTQHTNRRGGQLNELWEPHFKRPYRQQPRINKTKYFCLISQLLISVNPTTIGYFQSVLSPLSLEIL